VGKAVAKMLIVRDGVASAYVPASVALQHTIVFSDATVGVYMNVACVAAGVDGRSRAGATPPSAGSVQALPSPTTLIHGKPLVWKLVPVIISAACWLRTMVVGLIAVIVCAGSTTSNTIDGVASAYAPHCVADQHTMLPVAIADAVNSNVACVSEGIDADS
jgi:hypothetical protein